MAAGVSRSMGAAGRRWGGGGGGSIPVSLFQKSRAVAFNCKSIQYAAMSFPPGLSTRHAGGVHAARDGGPVITSRSSAQPHSCAPSSLMWRALSPSIFAQKEKRQAGGRQPRGAGGGPATPPTPIPPPPTIKTITPGQVATLVVENSKTLTLRSPDRYFCF